MSRIGNLLSRVGSLFAQAKQPAGQTRELGITPRDPNWDRVVVIPRDNKQLTEPFRQNTWVHGCVGAISSRVGLTPFTLRTGKKDKEKVIEDGDLYRVFNRPNPNWSTSQLFESASMHLELGGNAIFVLDRNSFTEVPLEIWVFGRWRFEPQFVKESRTVEWWKFRTSGSTWIRLEPYQVVHVGLVSPTGDHFGMAPMEAAMYAAKTDWLATGFNEKLLENGFSPGAVISWPEQGPNDLAGFKAKFLREHTSTPGSMDRAFRLALLTGGGTYQPMEYSARDAAYIEGRKMGRDEICVIFRVPVCVLGIGEKAGIIASGTPEAQSLKRFWGGTIKPRQKLIEDAWRAQFFWPFDDERTWPKFDTSEIEELQEERTAKVERVRILCGLGVPFNTANEKEGLGYDPIDGLDTGFLPMGMTPVEDVIDPPEKPAPIIMPPAAPTPLDPDAPEEPTPPKKPKPEDDEEEDPEEEKKSAPATSSAYVGTCPHCGEIELGSVPARPWHARAIRPYTDQHMVFCEEWEARVSPLERDFSSRLRNYLLKCRSFLNVKVDEALEASLKVGSLPQDFFDLSMSFDEMLRKISKTYFRKVAVEVGPLIESHINGAGVPFVFDPDNPALVKFLETKTIKVVSHVNQEAIREGVRDKLLESQKSNGTMEELRESLLDVIGDNRRRALTIARTETGQASNGLEHECNVEAGVKTRQWIANIDDRARDSHLEQMALGDWPVDKPFPNGLMYPGDINGPPEQVCNCRCRCLAIE